MVASHLLDSMHEIIVEVAAQEIMPRFRNLADGDISRKRDNSIVTAADIAAEAALEDRLTKLVPGSVVVGEEGCEKNPELLSLLGQQGLHWVVDPVDGTREFKEGKPRFGSMVALVQDGKVVAACIYDPNSGQTLMAERGSGVWVRSANSSDLSLRLVNADNPYVHHTINTGYEIYGRLKDAAAEILAGQRADLTLVNRSPAAFNYAQLMEYVPHSAPATLFGDAMEIRAVAVVSKKVAPAWDHMPGGFMVEELRGSRTTYNGDIYVPHHPGQGLVTAVNAEMGRMVRQALVSRL